MEIVRGKSGISQRVSSFPRIFKIPCEVLTVFHKFKMKYKDLVAEKPAEV